MIQRISSVFSMNYLVLLLALSACAVVNTASASEISDVATVRAFKLTPEFMHKWQAYEAAAAKRPCQLSPLLAFKKADGASMSLDQVIQAFAAQPGVSAELSKVGLTARQAILGLSVLTGAAMQEMAARYPQMAGQGDTGSAAVVSPANAAFYRKHRDTWHRYQMKLGQEMLQRNGGKMPACLGDSGN